MQSRCDKWLQKRSPFSTLVHLAKEGLEESLDSFPPSSSLAATCAVAATVAQQMSLAAAIGVTRDGRVVNIEALKGPQRPDPAQWL